MRHNLPHSCLEQAAEWLQVGKNCLALRPSGGNSWTGMNIRLATPGPGPVLAPNSVASAPTGIPRSFGAPRVQFEFGANWRGRPSAFSPLPLLAGSQPIRLGGASAWEFHAGAARGECDGNLGDTW